MKWGHASMLLQTFYQQIHYWSQSSDRKLRFQGVNLQIFCFFLKQYESKISLLYPKEALILFAPDNERAELLYHNLKSELSSFQLFYYPAPDAGPYSGIIPSESIFIERFKILAKLSQYNDPKPPLIITTAESYSLLSPSPDFFQKYQFVINVTDILPPLELAGMLNERGYQHTPTVEEPGSFCYRGEIFDIFTLDGQAWRIHYFDDMIEEIHQIDLTTQKTNRQISTDSIEIFPTPRIFAEHEFSINLRENIPIKSSGDKVKNHIRNSIFEGLSRGELFSEYTSLIPLFLKNTSTLDTYLHHFKPIFFVFNKWEVLQNARYFADQLNSEFDLASNANDFNSLLPAPDSFYDLKLLNHDHAHYVDFSNINIEHDLNGDSFDCLETGIENASTFLKQHLNPSLHRNQLLRESLLYLSKNFHSSGRIVFISNNNSFREKIAQLCELLGLEHFLNQRLEFFSGFIDRGFYYPAEELLILCEYDFFGEKKKQSSRPQQKEVDLFIEQIGTLKDGDFVIHNDHGMGIYKGLQGMTIGDVQSDYLVIEYQDKDKVYVPVYKMNLIQKYADSHHQLRPDNLKKNKFLKTKQRARESAKKLAFDLLKLQAQRQSQKAYAFSAPNDDFEEFEKSFPYTETKDQKLAIDEVIENMQRPTPMDHLVCGDVGFGKTEVAMRAAFKAVLDNKQVSVLVPTTVLALQHFHSFQNRFKDFPVNISFLSRFKSAKEAREILKELEKGNIDIIIGTHKLLSDNVKYHDLGLVIVDEEQRFGVGHKEKLKLLKSTVDFLTLTATPIPRTLQLSFLGLKELSLIKTPPPRRQSIKSYLIKFDDHTIQLAIKKELARGGQVFIVHNKVQSMNEFASYIKELVPNASIVTAHGQLPEKELESKMNDFYSGKYQILISTTIIESGIDIPNANTMIINRADTFGLSQLHQLRGRIGRSDKKAYCYFVIPGTKGVSTIAEKRLKALQTYADIGAGFNIATSDLEIRGAGDILGAQQSGHVEAVGLELYMELLKDAIAELQGNKDITYQNIEINVPFPSYIPSQYISESGQRLKYYKKLSGIKTLEDLESTVTEITDMFGPAQNEFFNLISVLKSRIYLQKIGLKSVQVVGKTIIFQFDKNLLNNNPQLQESLVGAFLGDSNYQFTPDYKVRYHHKHEIDPTDLVRLSQEVVKKIIPS